MSSIKLESNASGTGIFTIASPNSSTNRTLTLPDATGTIITTAGGAAISGTTGAFTSTVGVGGATPAASGAGITFPATQSASSDANTLDDYEEGTFTPTAYGLTTAGTTTYSTQDGDYTKIGNTVRVNIYLSVTNMTGTGTLAIGGLPFTSGFRSTGSVTTTDMNWDGGSSPVLVSETNQTYSRLFISGDNVTWTVQTVEAAWNMYATIVYKV